MIERSANCNNHQNRRHSYRLLHSGLKKRILYLADRNILVDQSIAQDFAPLEKTIYKVNFSDKECLREIASHEVNFALYHQMVGQNDEEHFRRIPAEYFDLIIVDECHRGSAKEDSNWRKVLEYFSSATQIGMTATPKESEKVSNIDYFGEPVYIYSLKQGIEDGFLTPFKVINITANIGDGWRPYQGQTDIFGNVIEDRIYNNRDYDYTIILQDRIDEVAREITEYLKSTDRMQKTIRADDHAAAEEIEDRTLGRRWMFSDDQARKAVYRDHFIMRLVVGGRKHTAIAVLLVNDLPDFIFRQSEHLFCAGEPVGCAQNRGKETHTINAPFSQCFSDLPMIRHAVRC